MTDDTRPRTDPETDRPTGAPNIYIDEDGAAWVPVAEATRGAAEPFALEAVGAETVTYAGIETVPTHEHEWDAEPCNDRCRTAVECHRFDWAS